MAVFWTLAATTLLLLSTVENNIDSKKIVFLPMAAGNSPYFIFLKLAEELQSRGHNTSIITTKLLRKRESEVVHIDYPVNSTRSDFQGLINSQVKGSEGQYGVLSAAPRMFKVVEGLCESLMEHKPALEELKTADLVVMLAPVPCHHYLMDQLDKPYIGVYPAVFTLFGFFAHVPLPPSYVPIIAATDRMSFLQRTINFLASVTRASLADLLITQAFKGFSKKYKAGEGKSFQQLFLQAEMYLVSSDFAVEFAHPLMPNTFYVGPILPSPARKLPQSLENIMEESGDEGVILISFGSEISSLNDEVIVEMIKALAQMKQIAIWKVKLPAGIEAPANVRILDWIPQNDLLGHPKTRAFVSHMGVNGANEAAFHAVPLVAACLMSDSYQNTLRFVEKAKMAKFIDVRNANSTIWKNTLDEVINNPSYKKNAVRVSKLMRSRRRSGAERSADLMEYTLDNGGRLPHLKAASYDLSWYQYFCLDVIAFLMVIIVLISFIIWKVFSFLCRRVKKMVSKEKVKKS